MIPNLSFYYRGLGRLWPMRDVTFWTARHVFGAAGVDDASGNGEPPPLVPLVDIKAKRVEIEALPGLMD